MIPCVGCSRFVRTDVHHCPFCGEVLRSELPSMVPVVAGALLGVMLTACVNNEATGEAYGGAEVETGTIPDRTSTTGDSSSSGDRRTTVTAGSESPTPIADSSSGTTMAESGSGTTMAESGSGTTMAESGSGSSSGNEG